jgi:acetyl esterase
MAGFQHRFTERTDSFSRPFSVAFHLFRAIAALAVLLSLPSCGDSTLSPPERRVFKSIDGHDLALDIYRPTDRSDLAPRPCIVWFFGGGWEVGLPAQYAAHARHFAGLGIVSVTPDYRVQSRHGSRTTPFDAVEDALDAFAWIRERADELGIDPERIAAAGGSSGGHLAAVCHLLRPEVLGDEGNTAGPNALILFNPVVDFEIPHIKRLVTPAELSRLSEIAPLSLLEGPLPPTLILHGVRDLIVPIRGSEAFVEKARELGSPQVELARFPKADHEFHLGGHATRRDAKESLRKILSFLEQIGWTKQR